MDNRDRQSRIERMKREKRRQERLRRRRIAIIKRCLAVGVVVAVLLLLVAGVWALVKPSVQKNASKKAQVEAPANINQEEGDGEINPNDGAGTSEQTPIETPTPSSGLGNDAGNQTALAHVPINDGPAAQKPIANSQELKHAVPGWQVDNLGWWYANSDNTYYENGWATLEGKKYFFNAEGYMQTGWTPIGQKGYFFDDVGQHNEDKKPKMVALTFDDGPGQHTERLLEILDENDAKATFFMVGQNLDDGEGFLVDRMRADGHELGNHTFTHADLTQLSEEEIRSEFGQVDARLNELSPGAVSVLVRPPYGAKNEKVLKNIGKPAIFWDIDTSDWQTKDVKSVTEIATNVTEGNIVLMHDIHETTVQACEEIIPKLVAQGYELVTITEMARAHGVDLQDGTPYYSFTEKDLANLWAAENAEPETDEE